VIYLDANATTPLDPAVMAAMMPALRTSSPASSRRSRSDEGKLRYSDFTYLAFTVGMTFKVSDTALHSHEFFEQPCGTPCCPTCSAPVSSPRRSTVTLGELAAS